MLSYVERLDGAFDLALVTVPLAHLPFALHSGKSTQVPSFILEHDMRRGRPVKIYCTEVRLSYSQEAIYSPLMLTLPLTATPNLSHFTRSACFYRAWRSSWCLWRPKLICRLLHQTRCTGFAVFEDYLCYDRTSCFPPVSKALNKPRWLTIC